MTPAPLAPCILAAGFFPEVLTTCAVAVACAVLSVFVVSRRWAFIGEGISHSGFGGAGTVWLLALAFPALDAPAAVYAGVVAFCLAAGWGIAFFSRARGVAAPGPGAGGSSGGAANTDAVIGIFLVASVAWGFLARYCYERAHGGRTPAGFEEYLFGRPADLTLPFALGAAFVCAAVVVVVVLLGKEIVYYCFDPAMAEASGVHGGFIHYLLILLVTLTIVVGARVAGSILVTALLVLPGATALLLSDDLRRSVTGSVLFGMVGATGGLLAHWKWPFLPTGPAIVLVMFASFVLVSAWTRVRARSAS
jgi:ABC-type Mn2+/Zn2+ transport system permease subunit